MLVCPLDVTTQDVPRPVVCDLGIPVPAGTMTIPTIMMMVSVTIFSWFLFPWPFIHTHVVRIPLFPLSLLLVQSLTTMPVSWVVWFFCLVVIGAALWYVPLDDNHDEGIQRNRNRWPGGKRKENGSKLSGNFGKQFGRRWGWGCYLFPQTQWCMGIIADRFIVLQYSNERIFAEIR